MGGTRAEKIVGAFVLKLSCVQLHVRPWLKIICILLISVRITFCSCNERKHSGFDNKNIMIFSKQIRFMLYQKSNKIT